MVGRRQDLDALGLQRSRRRTLAPICGRVRVAVPGEEQLGGGDASASTSGPAVSPSIGVRRREGHDRVDLSSALRGVRRATRCRPCSRRPARSRRTPLVRRYPTAPATSCQIAEMSLLALRAAGVTAGTVAAEVERQDAVAEAAEPVGEVEPRALVRGQHVRKHDAGGGVLGPEDPPGELARRPIDVERTRPGSRRAPACGSPRPGGRPEARPSAATDTEPIRDRTSSEPVGARTGTSGRATCPASSAGGACASGASCASSSASSCGAS